MHLLLSNTTMMLLFIFFFIISRVLSLLLILVRAFCCTKFVGVPSLCNARTTLTNPALQSVIMEHLFGHGLTHFSLYLFVSLNMNMCDFCVAVREIRQLYTLRKN